MNTTFVKLSDVAEMQGGFAFKSREFQNNGIHLIRIGELVNSKVVFRENSVYVSEKYLEKYSKYFVKEDDILIALSGATTGKFSKYNLKERALLNQRVLRLRAKSNIDNSFLYYYIFILKKYIENKAAGAAQPNISPKGIGDFTIALPPLRIQKKIVEILDKAQELIGMRKHQIQLLDDLIQSIFYDMFGDPKLNQKDWSVILLEQLGNLQSGGTPSRGNPEYFEGDIPWISTTALGKRYIDETCANELITNEAIKNSATKIVPEFSIIIGVRVGVGKVSINTCELCTSQDIMSLTNLSSKINTTFLWYQIKTFNKSLINNQRGATIQGITAKLLKSLEMTIPPLELQENFSSKVELIELQKDFMQRAISKLENNYNNLLQRAFKGELFPE